MTTTPTTAMDRTANNARLERIVLDHRLPDGSIPALEVAKMRHELIALLDELVDAAYTEGERDDRADICGLPLPGESFTFARTAPWNRDRIYMLAEVAEDELALTTRREDGSSLRFCMTPAEFWALDPQPVETGESDN